MCIRDRCSTRDTLSGLGWGQLCSTVAAVSTHRGVGYGRSPHRRTRSVTSSPSTSTGAPRATCAAAEAYARRATSDFSASDDERSVRSSGAACGATCARTDSHVRRAGCGGSDPVQSRAAGLARLGQGRGLLGSGWRRAVRHVVGLLLRELHDEACGARARGQPGSAREESHDRRESGGLRARRAEKD
eukprot:5962473-Prymnesium_polylepis.1